MTPTIRQTIIVVCIPTAGVIVIGLWLAEDFLCLRDNPGMYVGELKPGSGIFAWWRELNGLDGAWIIRRVVGDGEVIKEMVLGVGSIAPVGFDEIGRIVPEAVKDTSVAC
jgi:hypothetical protein